MRLGSGVGDVGRLVGDCVIFFFLGDFWLPLRKVVYRIAGFKPSEKCHLSCFWGWDEFRGVPEPQQGRVRLSGVVGASFSERNRASLTEQPKLMKFPYGNDPYF